MAALLVRAIVAGEKDEGVFGESARAEPGDDAADVAINIEHHAREALLLRGPVPAGERTEIGHLHAALEVALATFVIGVRRVERKVEEERLGLRRVDEAERRVDDQGRRVVLRVPGETVAAAAERSGIAARDEIVPERFAAAVADEKRWKQIVRVKHVHVAVEFVETLPVRVVLREHVSDAPFAERGGDIAGCTQ